MLTRRDTLRLAAATAAAPVASFAVSPEGAAALLDDLIVPDAGPEGRYGYGRFTTEGATDPVAWAEYTHGLLDFADGGASVADQWATYKQALDDVAAAAPDAFTAAGLVNPLGRLDDAVSDMATLAFMAGVRAGAAIEHLRLALTPASRICRHCNGHGRRHGVEIVNGERHYALTTDAAAPPCPDCGGAGTLATPTPVLDLADL